MALFAGRDRTGANVDFNSDGDASGLSVGVAVVAKIPVVLGRETRTVSTGSVALASIPAGATHALITVEDADVRYWEDGATTAPTGTAGLLFISGSTDEFTNLATLRFIRKSTATQDGVLQVSYRKYSG